MLTSARVPDRGSKAVRRGRDLAAGRRAVLSVHRGPGRRRCKVRGRPEIPGQSQVARVSLQVQGRLPDVHHKGFGWVLHGKDRGGLQDLDGRSRQHDGALQQLEDVPEMHWCNRQQRVVCGHVAVARNDDVDCRIRDGLSRHALVFTKRMASSLKKAARGLPGTVCAESGRGSAASTL